MVRRFRHPVNAADLLGGQGSTEKPFTVKARTQYPALEIVSRRSPHAVGEKTHELVRMRPGNACSRTG
jgi:hypothetical protein